MIKNSKYFLIVLPIFLASCLGKFVTSEADTLAAEEANTILSYAQTNKLTADKTGIYYTVLRKNDTGEAANLASDFYVAYSLKTLAGVEISSKTSRDSIILNLYTANLFPGFVNSLFLLKEGEKGQFVIPSSLAYGQNPPTGLPKSSPILAEIEILELLNENDKIENYLKKKGLKVEEKTSTGLRFIRLNAANTNPVLQKGDNITLKYNGMFLSEKSFDSGTLGYVVGNKSFIEGFLEGINKLKKGEKARVIFPSKIGYGENGSGNSIPPYTPLIFDIEITTVNGS
jgi:FKBP-type peptidyl-prolyl cis-trans isomerase